MSYVICHIAIAIDVSSVVDVSSIAGNVDDAGNVDVDDIHIHIRDRRFQHPALLETSTSTIAIAIRSVIDSYIAIHIHIRDRQFQQCWMLETSTSMTLYTCIALAGKFPAYAGCWNRRRRSTTSTSTVDVDRRRRRSTSIAGRFNGPLKSCKF